MKYLKPVTNYIIALGLWDYQMLRKVPADNTQLFLTYKQEKLKITSELEGKRLEDLKGARATIFKYALPATIIDRAAGALATLLGMNVFILFYSLSRSLLSWYFLADALDRKKYQERTDIMNRTKKELGEIRREETQLLGVDTWDVQTYLRSEGSSFVSNTTHWVPL